MEELKVPTCRITVEVHCSGGIPMRGAIYHADSPYETGKAEQLAATLNDERDFVPFSPETGTASDELLNKQHVLRVRVDEIAPLTLRPDETAELARTSVCTLLLTDGARVSGQLVVTSRDAASRILDKVNQHLRFLPLLTDCGLEFVNRSHVVHVRFL